MVGHGCRRRSAIAVRPLVVEDRAGFGSSLRSQLIRLGVEADWLTHPAALARPAGQWAKRPLVLLDALDLSSQQDDDSCSRLASLDVLEQVRKLPADRRPVVVVYSTDMARPEVNIPLRSWGVASAFFELRVLVTHLRDVLVGGDHSHQVAAPVEGDWHDLHPQLAVGADVASIHQLMRSNERVWRQVWMYDAPFDRAAMMWIRRNVLRRVGPAAGYRSAIDVARKVAGLPRQR
jgi:hypothetical protein